LFSGTPGHRETFPQAPDPSARPSSRRHDPAGRLARPRQAGLHAPLPPAPATAAAPTVAPVASLLPPAGGGPDAISADPGPGGASSAGPRARRPGVPRGGGALGRARGISLGERQAPRGGRAHGDDDPPGLRWS